ncbi:hypothetical protein ANN_05647 [Periplaneta americana]|uniref:Angiotensin-converting enzyme n=1 Tax=Periplaneta americana TaxID=6978 RepID=A0ABQ8TBE3_PERAM|nr:hypothetical protein ANN_05647 [Periplaneta americana]
MTGLCEGGNELLGSLKAISTTAFVSALQQLDAEYRRSNARAAALTWRLAVDPDAVPAELVARVAEQRTAWRNAWCARDVAPGSRQMYLLCRGPKYTPHQASELNALLGRLQRLYSDARVCRGPVCYRGEPDLERLMARSRDPAELLWGWVAWRQAVGPPARPLYPAVVGLMNQGARSNGYPDAGAAWREELETPGLELVAERLFARAAPLYRLLHAVVRHRLGLLHGAEVVPPRGPIPAHLLGNMWAQDWGALLDLLLPGRAPSLTAALRLRNYTATDMVRRAEDFYTSLGLEPMTPSFWKHSQIERPRNSSGTCHGTAANMFRPGDFRMLLCAEVNEEDFYVIHHEMGHIEYYMAYRHQPVLFQEGANSAFQEAVGDAITYGVMAPQHLQRLGLSNGTEQEEQRLRVFENKVLRKIFGAKKDEVTGEWRKLHNTELHALYSSPDIIRNIKSRHLRWAGHVARMGDSRNAYRVLVGRPEGKRPLGRPRRRWEDNIKMDLMEVGYDDRDWINLAQDRDRWQAYQTTLHEEEYATCVTDDGDLVLLLRRALSKLPQLPFGLLVDKWRWSVFRGDTPPQQYNSAWWELKRHYQGVVPPVARTEDDFDPAAKFHIADNTPYIR